MTDRLLSRRSLLLALAGIGGFAATGRALAMNRQTIASGSELGAAYANRCTSQVDSSHAQLVGDLQAMLLQRTGAKGEVLTQTAYCPICGCPVTVARTVD